MRTNLTILSSVLAATSIFVFTGCAPQAPPQTTAEKAVEKIGWTFQFPGNWTQMTPDQIAELEGKARDTVEEVVGGKLEESHQNILYLKKDPFNMFTSTMQKFDPDTDGPYDALQKELFEIYLETYRKAGVEFDHEAGSKTIDGLEFKTLSVSIYKPGTKTVIMNQIMYDRLIGGKNSLLFSLNWNNPSDRKVLQGILDSSTFSIRD